MRSGWPFSPLTTRWSSHTFSARVRGRSGMPDASGLLIALFSSEGTAPVRDGARDELRDEGGLRLGLVAAAKEKASDPHSPRLPLGPDAPAPSDAGRQASERGWSTVGGVPFSSATTAAACADGAMPAGASAAAASAAASGVPFFLSREDAMRLATVATVM